MKVISKKRTEEIINEEIIKFVETKKKEQEFDNFAYSFTEVFMEALESTDRHLFSKIYEDLSKYVRLYSKDEGTEYLKENFTLTEKKVYNKGPDQNISKEYFEKHALKMIQERYPNVKKYKITRSQQSSPIYEIYFDLLDESGKTIDSDHYALVFKQSAEPLFRKSDKVFLDENGQLTLKQTPKLLENIRIYGEW
jgi:uncharacterized membrane protein